LATALRSEAANSKAGFFSSHAHAAGCAALKAQTRSASLVALRVAACWRDLARLSAEALKVFLPAPLQAKQGPSARPE